MCVSFRGCTLRLERLQGSYPLWPFAFGQHASRLTSEFIFSSTSDQRMLETQVFIKIGNTRLVDITLSRRNVVDIAIDLPSNPLSQRHLIKRVTIHLDPMPTWINHFQDSTVIFRVG